MRLGILADVHGNDMALRAVLKDADRLGIDRWWALGDLVLFGPRPAEVLELLLGLPGISWKTTAAPWPSPTAARLSTSMPLSATFADDAIPTPGSSPPSSPASGAPSE